MEKRKVILPTKRYFKSPEEDLTIRLNLNEEKNLLREGDKDIVLDINELFNKERNDSVNYKIYGKLKMVFRNNYYGDSSYYYLKNRLYLVSDGSDGNFNGYLPYDEFALLRKDFLREVNIPSSGSSLTNFTQNVVLSGYTGHTTLTNIDAPYQNWNVYLSYIHTQDSNRQMKYTLSGNTTYDFIASDGIPFRVTSNNRYYILTSPVEHGFSAGEYITISTSGNTFYTYSGTTLVTTTDLTARTFYIESVGNEYYNSEKYVINILKNEVVSGTTFDNVVFGKRCLDKNNITGTTSSYYVHKHKILTSTEDYILDKLGFESPIWEDEKKLLFENFNGDNDVLVERNIMESVIYDFKEPLKLTGITSNLGYTPTDVYVTVIFRNGNGFFEYPPKVGYKFNFHDSWIDNHFSGTTSNETNLTYTTFTGNTNAVGYSGFTFKGGDTLDVGDELFGAFVEYNDVELKERIVSNAYHKIHNPTEIFDYGQTGDTSTFTGVTTDNPFGLFYQPHYKVKLRELSPYIETSNTKDIINLPENAKYYENEGLWKWRDLYDQGFIDQDGNGVNHPFINNTHYIKNDINFYLRNEADFINKSDGIRNFLYELCSTDESSVDLSTPTTPTPTPTPTITPSSTSQSTPTPTPTQTITPTVSPLPKYTIRFSGSTSSQITPPQPNGITISYRVDGGSWTNIAGTSSYDPNTPSNFGTIQIYSGSTLDVAVLNFPSATSGVTFGAVLTTPPASSTGYCGKGSPYTLTNVTSDKIIIVNAQVIGGVFLTC